MGMPSQMGSPCLKMAVAFSLFKKPRSEGCDFLSITYLGERSVAGRYCFFLLADLNGGVTQLLGVKALSNRAIASGNILANASAPTPLSAVKMRFILDFLPKSVFNINFPRELVNLFPGIKFSNANLNSGNLEILRINSSLLTNPWQFLNAWEESSSFHV